MRHCPAALALLTAVLPLAAQLPPPADPSFRVSVNLVQVDAEVTDSRGNHVRDLNAEDFQVLEDGKAQKITNFSWVSVTPPQGLTPAEPNAPPARALRKEEVRRALVLMLDDAGTNSCDLEAIRRDMHKFIDEQVQPGDLVAVTASRGGMGFYSRFTTDKRQLHDAIEHLGDRHGWLMCDYPRTVLRGPAFTPTAAECEPANPLGYLTWAIQGLREMPGRKAVVLFSHFFPAPPATIELANSAGVVIYVIDTVGIKDPCGRGPGGLTEEFGVIASAAPYRQLAKQTGGLFILSAPGGPLREDLGKVLEDMSGYYLIGYQPGRSDFELVRGQPVHHTIDVKVRRAGLIVRARNGFLGVPDRPAEASAPRTTHQYLQAALASPFNAGSMRLQIDPLYAASLPDPKTKLRQPSLHTILEVDGRDLAFVTAEDGGSKVKESVLVAVFNQDGAPVASAERTFTFSPTDEESRQLETSGFLSAMDVKLPGPGKYQVRAAVRDENSGDQGSASSFLEVPDFNKPGITLSSIELSAPRSHPQGSGTSWADYPAGSAIRFECDVFGIRTAPQPPKEPRVEMEVRLFRGGGTEPVFDSRTLPVSSKTLVQNYVAGQVRIGSDLTPGDYMLQLMVFDRLASPKKQTAIQWTSLTVVKPAP